MKLLLVSGAPATGKDTFAEIMLKNFPYQTVHERFSIPIKNACKGFFRNSGLIYSYDSHEKDKKLGEIEELLKETSFSSKTIREIEILFSEEFIKKSFGDAILGEMLAYRILNNYVCPEDRLFIVTGAGFMAEINALIEKLPAYDIFHVHLTRPGCTYELDSRNEVFLSGEVITEPTYTLHNKYNNIDAFQSQIMDALDYLDINIQ